MQNHSKQLVSLGLAVAVLLVGYDADAVLFFRILSFSLSPPSSLLPGTLFRFLIDKASHIHLGDLSLGGDWGVSQDTLPSPFPIASLSKYDYSGLVPRCSTSDVHSTPVSTAVSIVFSKTVRSERSDRPNCMTPDIHADRRLISPWFRVNASGPAASWQIIRRAYGRTGERGHRVLSPEFVLVL